MAVLVRLELMLPDWCGADEAFEEGGEEAIKELVMENMNAFSENAKWDVARFVAHVSNVKP